MPKLQNPEGVKANQEPVVETPLKRVADCLAKHKRYAHLGNGYLEEAEEIIGAALRK